MQVNTHNHITYINFLKINLEKRLNKWVDVSKVQQWFYGFPCVTLNNNVITGAARRELSVEVSAWYCATEPLVWHPTSHTHSQAQSWWLPYGISQCPNKSVWPPKHHQQVWGPSEQYSQNVGGHYNQMCKLQAAQRKLTSAKESETVVYSRSPHSITQ